MPIVYVDFNKCGPRDYYKDGEGCSISCEHGRAYRNEAIIVFCTKCQTAERERAKCESLAAAAEKKDHAPTAAMPTPVSGDTDAAARRFNLIEGIYKLKDARERDAIRRRFTSCEPIESSPALDELIQRFERELEFLYATPAKTEPVIPDPRV